MRTITLPPQPEQPDPTDSLSQNGELSRNYKSALEAWERVCCALVAQAETPAPSPDPTGDRALRAVIANYLRAAIRTCDTTDGPVAAVDRMADVIEKALPALPVAAETLTTCEVCGAPFSIDDMGVKMLTGGHRHYRRCLNAHQKKELNNAD